MFSIITPILGAQQFYSQYIKCLKSQTFTDWEAIVVFDDYNANSDFCNFSSLCDDDSRFILLKRPSSYHKEIHSPYQARNFGIDLSNNPFICFLDIDDYWASSKLMELNHQILNT